MELLKLDETTLIERKDVLENEIDKYRDLDLDLNMARGKPCKKQLDISDGMINCNIDFKRYRNYGVLDGIIEVKNAFKDILGVTTDELLIGGNSSLRMMYDAMTKCLLLGNVDSKMPWGRCQGEIKFLCPVPGYDRHFAICEEFGIKMINIPMLEDGPDMDMVEKLVASDPLVKGMWCMPKYGNPTGITYSTKVVKRLASMKVAAKDFRLFWDDAYNVHHLSDEEIEVTNILEECRKVGNPNRVYMFASTSKITYPGAGVGMMGCSLENADFIRSQMAIQTIGSDKINQLMHAEFLPNIQAVNAHMKKHSDILKPKFDLVQDEFAKKLGGLGIASWTEPKGGYFISLDVMKGCAKEVVGICKELGVTLTKAGATFPYGIDPEDSNIRIAPTFPPLEELADAIKVLCTVIEYVAITKLLQKN